MNAERLLQHYEQIADAPDAIARLRRFILDLAVRGKLTSYRLSEAEIMRLGDLSEFIMGQAPPGNSYNENGHGTVFVKVGEFGERFPVHAAWTTEPLKFAKQGDVLICVVGATIGKLNLAIDCAIGRSVAAIRPQARLDQVFLYYSLMPVTMRLREDSRGTAQGVISRPDLADIPIWCPPLAEQRRIVAKVDELMGLCDRLEAARAGREAVRDRLVAASLARLNAPDPETFQDDARFALDALPALTTRPDQIKRLRQTILNLAVRGKLVPQDANDEPASEVDLKIKNRKRGQVQESIEPPFGLPVGWAWRAIDTLADQVTDGEHATPPRISETQVPLVTAKNVREGFMDYSQTDWVSFETAIKAWGRCRPQVGDLLLVCVGATTGRLTVLREPRDMVLVRSVALIRPNSDVLNEYLERAIRSPFVQQQIWASVKAAAQPCLYINRIQSLLIPLPPLAEQHRIVAKVDALMALCDRLEASLAATAATRRRLLDALLAEALAPAEDSELEAAE